MKASDKIRERIATYVTDADMYGVIDGARDQLEWALELIEEREREQAASERTAIVRWLRVAYQFNVSVQPFADAIEKGVHREPYDPPTGFETHERCTIGGVDYTFAYWGIDAHDGAGWYYFETEESQEGSVGRFDTLDEAKAHAATHLVIPPEAQP